MGLTVWVWLCSAAGLCTHAVGAKVMDALLSSYPREDGRLLRMELYGKEAMLLLPKRPGGYDLKAVLDELPERRYGTSKEGSMHHHGAGGRRGGLPSGLVVMSWGLVGVSQGERAGPCGQDHPAHGGQGAGRTGIRPGRHPHLSDRDTSLRVAG